MLFTYTLLALLPSLYAKPTPVQKRATNQLIRSYRTNTCLTLQAGVQIVDGSLLKVGDCATATRWDISPGSGSVIVSGTNFALDAGSNPGNNVPAKVWTSYPGLTQQTWYLTDDNRIAITGGNQCLDEGDNGPQTYQCTTGNTNQIWYVSSAPPPPSSTSSSASSTSSSAMPTASSTIVWGGANQCVSVIGGNFANGAVVALAPCVAFYSSDYKYQNWVIQGNGQIQIAGQNFCLDAGENPGNGSGMKIWQCYPGLLQQTWGYNNQLFGLSNNQCLDVVAGSQPRPGSLQDLQTWACSAPDPQQKFYTRP